MKYWSTKNWGASEGANPLEQMINDAVDPSQVNIENIKVQNELNPKVWDFDTINPKVRKLLLKIAYRFWKHLDLEGVKLKDIILKGSMANYNWNKTSDIDLHLVIDFGDIGPDEDFIGSALRSRSASWNDKTDIKMFGHDVELYVENEGDTTNTTNGVYSLIDDEWLHKLQKKMMIIDKKEIAQKAAKFMNYIDDLEGDPDIDKKIEKLKLKLRNYRQKGLDSKHSELSLENLVYKVLRQNDYLEKVNNLKNDFLSKELSMEGNFKP